MGFENERIRFQQPHIRTVSMRKVLYQLFVNGIPKAQPRPRMTAKGHVYNPNSADAWKEEIKNVFRPVLKQTIDEPVFLRVSFFLPGKTSSVSEQNIPFEKKPDLDNLLKAVMDAMTNIGVWKDDALVCATDTSKWYAKKKTGAQIIVEIF